MKKKMHIAIPVTIAALMIFVWQFYLHVENVPKPYTKVWTGQSQDGRWRVEYKNNQRLGAIITCSGWLYYEGDAKEHLEFVSYEYRENGRIATSHDNIELVFPYEFVVGGHEPQKEDNFILHLKWKENGEMHQTKIIIEPMNSNIKLGT